MLFLASVLIVSAVGSGVLPMPEKAKTQPPPVATLVPASHLHHHGQKLQVQRAPGAIGLFLAPINAPSSLVLSQVGESLVQPKPED